jgi:hypothetical protein
VLSDNTHIAKFKRQDLVDVTPGDAVMLTVKGTFMHNAQQAQIPASDTTRVIE